MQRDESITLPTYLWITEQLFNQPINDSSQLLYSPIIPQLNHIDSKTTPDKANNKAKYNPT